jgi:hypothetical protein
MQWAVSFATQATGQPPTAPANAQWLLPSKLRQKCSGKGIVTVFSRPMKQTFDLSARSPDAAIHQRDGKVISSFLAAVLRRVVTADGSSVCFDGCRSVTACPDTVLEAVANFDPCIAVVGTGGSPPPMKGAPGVAQFSVGGRDVVRRNRIATTKPFLECLNDNPISSWIGHAVSCSV